MDVKGRVSGLDVEYWRDGGGETTHIHPTDYNSSLTTQLVSWSLPGGLKMLPVIKREREREREREVEEVR